jgi:hypothetical protein
MKISEWIHGGAVVVAILASITALAAAVIVLVKLVGEPSPVEAPRGTVERRLHLKLESPMDSDKPRRFVCREEP